MIVAIAQYTELLLAEARQEIACQSRHGAGRRLARWLLTCADKTCSPKLDLSQEFLAMLIGAQRTTVNGYAQ